MIIMGMTAFEIFGVLKLDKKDFDSGLSSATSAASGFGGTLMSVAGKGASAIGTGLAAAAKIGTAALTAATGAAVKFGKDAIGAATSFETAFTGVKKTVDATEEEYAELSSWIMDASTKMASSKEAIAGTMEIAGQLGISGVENLEKFTETMVMLGDTTNLSSEEAASALAKFSNITGDGSENITNIGSAIVDLGNNFATTEADIVAMSTRLASAGTIAGLTSTDILGLATAMSSVGITAEAGGTAMAQTMASMTKAVESAMPYLSTPYEALDDEGKAMMEDLQMYADVSNMTAQEFATAWKGEPIDAIQAFIGGLGDMNEADQSVVMMLDKMGLKGIRQTNMLQALALASDTMTDAVNTANNAYEQNIALQNEANTRYGTTESQVIQATEAFKNLQVMVGEKLKPTYQEFLSFSQVAMKDISAGLETGGLSGMMEAMGQALADGLNQFGELIPVAIDAGMQLLGALAEGIADNADAIFDAFGQVAGKLGTALLDLMELALQSLEGIDFKSATDNVLANLGDAFANGDAGEFLQVGADIIGHLIRGLVESAQSLFENAGNIVLWICNGIAQKLPTLIPTAVKLVAEFAKGITNPTNLTKIIQGAGVLLVSLAQGILNAIPDLLQAIPVVIANLVGAIIAAIPQLISVGIQLIVALITGIVGAIPDLFSIGPSLIAAVVGGIVQGISSIIETGGALVDGFLKGIKDAWNGMVTSVVGFFTGLIDRVKELFGVHSPSTVFATIGSDLIQGLINGIQNMLGALKDKAEEIVKQFEDLPDKMLEIGGNIVEGIWNGISNGYDWITDKISGWVGSVLAFIKKAFGIESPSKLMRDQVGVWVGKGVAVGITKSLPDVQAAMDEMTNMIETPDLSTTVAMAPTNQYSSYNESEAMKHEEEQEHFVDTLANAIVNAFVKADVGVEVDNREFGRLVRKAVTV